MTTAIISVFVGACAISFALTLAMRRIAPRIGLVDRPDGFRKLHQRATPLGGGVAVFLASTGLIAAINILPTPLRAELQEDTPNLWPLLAAALTIEAVGSLCLITGYQARSAAAVMFVYLGIVSVRLHAFWQMTGMAAAGTETQFFKNLGMMGGLLMIAVYGPGRWALGGSNTESRL